MTQPFSEPPGFWRTVRLLLGTARKRSSGRRSRQQELIQERSGGKGTDWGQLGTIVTFLFMGALHIMAAFVIREAVDAAQWVKAKQDGKIVVSKSFFDAAQEAIAEDRKWQIAIRDLSMQSQYDSEARQIAEREGDSRAEVEQRLRKEIAANGTKNLTLQSDLPQGLGAIKQSSSLAAFFGSVLLILWAVMVVFQGEGLEMDLQRRRHPMWEWIFSHPVRPGPVFFAEMLTPIAANPIYWCAPLFAGFLFGIAYDAGTGFLAVLLVGIPVTIAAASLGKSAEIAVILRFSPRNRGAVMGIMSWLGYATMMLFFFGLFFVSKIGALAAIAGKVGAYLTFVPWPWLGLFLGVQRDGSFSFFSGIVACWAMAGIVTASSVWFSVWGARQGLSGNVTAKDMQPNRKRGGTPFAKNAVYRKEALWFMRDRSAIVQAVLVPVTVAAFQLFNFRWILSHAQEQWNYLCGAAILFGTYFLWVLGPKSLASEGRALWIALTWPTGLESLLKAKAWLWSLISSGLVALVLVYATFQFPGSTWKVGLVFVGWFFFSRSMAEKSVTLVTVMSESGEPEKIPATRRWAAQLGMLTFAIGILTQHWPLAATGIVYSYITAAAMWQNLRARLPYLYDPWSETLPAPPTLMHAMISISILVEVGAVFTGIFAGLAGRENVAIAQTIAYAISAVGVSLGVWSFLGGRGVSLSQVTHWPESRTEPEPWWRSDGPGKRKLAKLVALGGACGAALGLVAIGYTAILQQIPSVAETLRKSAEEIAKIPLLKESLRVMAIGFAPFAEEYLFRGLVYRALDREWGGWRAVVGSAAFFAIYHSPLAWLPVGMLGVANALIFKKTGRLGPAIALHMIYNAVVLWR